MKMKRIMMVLCIMLIWCSMMVFANASSSKIKVIVNGSNLGDIGALVDGNTYLPLRKIGESLNAIVGWDADSKSALIYKPNVHMFIYNSSNGSETTFGEVA